MTSIRVIAAAAAVLALTACGSDAKPTTPTGQLIASPNPSESPSPSPSPSPSAVAVADTTAVVPTTQPPAVKTTPPAAPKTTKAAPPPAVYYANCDAVKAAGAAPLHRGEPGYRSGLDRDGDGVACEK